MEEDVKGHTFNTAMAQVQVNGMADIIIKALFVICERQKLIEKLREEIISVLSSSSNLHLMDSVPKETQRINPLALRWRDINVGCYKQAFPMIRNVCEISGKYPNAAPLKIMPWNTIHADSSFIL